MQMSVFTPPLERPFVALTVQLVPVGAVGDAVRERLVAVVAGAHHRIVGRIDGGQPLEEHVIGGGTVLAAFAVFAVRGRIGQS